MTFARVFQSMRGGLPVRFSPPKPAQARSAPASEIRPQSVCREIDRAKAWKENSGRCNPAAVIPGKGMPLSWRPESIRGMNPPSLPWTLSRETLREADYGCRLEPPPASPAGSYFTFAPASCAIAASVVWAAFSPRRKSLSENVEKTSIGWCQVGSHPIPT